MKLVTAIIKPQHVEAVSDALHDIDVGGMTIAEVRGHGRQRGHTEVYRGGEYTVDFVPKMEIRVVTHDSETEKVANTIIDAARSGKIGDGKVWIQPLEMVVRVRTGEIGDEAI
ncbi:MAG TPA: P-II family nitrogen regulator [Acidimicrobiia bacterium]